MKKEQNANRPLPGTRNYIVKYNSNPRLETDNHKSEVNLLIDIDERGFEEIDQALIFLSECTNPITQVEDLVPKLKNCPKHKYLQAEQNIKVKHVLIQDMENMNFPYEMIDWG
jgi:hypothetical protein